MIHGDSSLSDIVFDSHLLPHRIFLNDNTRSQPCLPICCSYCSIKDIIHVTHLHNDNSIFFDYSERRVLSQALAFAPIAASPQPLTVPSMIWVFHLPEQASTPYMWRWMRLIVRFSSLFPWSTHKVFIFKKSNLPDLFCSLVSDAQKIRYCRIGLRSTSLPSHTNLCQPLLPSVTTMQAMPQNPCGKCYWFSVN